MPKKKIVPEKKPAAKNGLLYVVHRHAKDHFIPHEGNNHVPHVLSHRVLLGYSVAMVLLKILVIATPLLLPSASLYSSAITPKNIVDLTNAVRRSLHIPELNQNAALDQAATAKGKDMLAKGYFAHTSPQGVTPWSWIRNAGYKYRSAGENLAVHYTSAEGVKDAWLASPSHRANIVSTKYSEIGVGVVQGTFENFPSILVVQMFGKPLEPEPPAAKKTTTPTTPSLDAEGTDLSTIAIPARVAAAETTIEGPSDEVDAIADPTAVAMVPEVDETTTQIIPQPRNEYRIGVTVHGAKEVSAALGVNWATLHPGTAPDRWEGTLVADPDTLSVGGDALQIIAFGEQGSKLIFPLAIIAPGAGVQDIYAFTSGAQRSEKILGFIPLAGLDDTARRIYIISIIFLSGALLLNVLIKIQVQRPSIIAHTLLLIGLAVLLSVV
ncbi:hypothetical protein KBD18_01785 [Patescibacteria group bacterium]|nr:hypothetical protein [Patescibacteria group bacterium]